MEAWLKDLGATGLDDLELGHFEATGRGIRSLRQFKQGEKILTIPANAVLTVEIAMRDPRFGPVFKSLEVHLSADTLLAVYLLYVRSRPFGYDGPCSYIATFPLTYTASIFYSDDELRVCSGSALHDGTKRLQQLIEGDYESLERRVFSRNPILFPPNEFTLEQYKWAVCTLWSRAMHCQLPDGTQIRVLAPFADMFNHSLEAGQCISYDSSSGELSVVADKDYAVGDQIFISYGNMSNHQLLLTYGFILLSNPCDAHDIVLVSRPKVPLFAMKKDLWALAGLCPVFTVSLTLADPLPKSVLRYLRIQQLTESEVVPVARQQFPAVEKVSHRNELGVLRYLVEAVENMLSSFAIQLEKLEQQLAEGLYSPGGNEWMAAQVCLGEQRVLRLTEKTAENLLTEEINKGEDDLLTAKERIWTCRNCRDDVLTEESKKERDDLSPIEESVKGPDDLSMAGGSETQVDDGLTAEESGTRSENSLTEESTEGGDGLLTAKASITRCRNCGDASVSLRKCAKCKAAWYCGRDCQVDHFPEHKAKCRALAGAA